MTQKFIANNYDEVVEDELIKAEKKSKLNNEVEQTHEF